MLPFPPDCPLLFVISFYSVNLNPGSKIFIFLKNIPGYYIILSPTFQCASSMGTKTRNTATQFFSSRFLARQAAAHLDPSMTVSLLSADLRDHDT